MQPVPILCAWLLALALAACAAPPATGQAASTPAPVVKAAGGAGDDPLQLDRSCRADSDCAVKNVGNCCGYFPACVNREAQPDPEAVRARCAETGMASVCGFREISACSCVQNRCEAVRQSLQAPLE
ncbi:hypothetical protein [Luteimonas sp. R10]|uniref:hypothetical protein n=1 Tax=Luteimonas sp. R10 TaxID=3108176 RepID=UPI00308A8654|nr:hypothetical protein U3649_07450 [Luteimonas sp. R10]